MESTARMFESVNGELQGMLHALMSELEPLRQRWQGQGGASFERVKQAFHADQQALNRALLDTAEAIRSAGSSYAAADEGSSTVVAHALPPRTLPL